MSKIEEAIEKLMKITDRNICFPRKEELNEVICLLQEEIELRRTEEQETTSSRQSKL